MRVLHLIQSLGRGGAERVALQLADGMASRGWVAEVAVLTSTDEFPDYAAARKSHLLRQRAFNWPGCLPAAVHALRAKVRAFQPDCIEIHSPTAGLIYAISSCRVPAVQVLHGHDSAWAAGVSPRRGVSLAVRRWAARRMRRHVAVSRGLARAARMALRVPARCLDCVPNGVDTNVFAPVPRNLDERAVVVVLGRMIPGKEPSKALQAFALLRARRPNAQLWFVGDGPMRSALAREAESQGIAGQVRFWGIQTDVAAVLQQAHLLWQLSAGEGLPVVCLEAMAAGLPVVASTVSGNTEVVEDGVTGWLVNRGDAGEVARVSDESLAASALYSQLALAARQRVTSRFSLTSMIDGHMAAMEAACSA